MKLDSDNVLKGIFAALAASCSGREREGLPLTEVEGVPCTLDAVNKVVQTGEGAEQRWFEVALHDVTPRRFLPRDEQTEILYGETEEWWSVTGPSRHSFVRARSRSLAMQYFSAKWHEMASDCELARGFEFVDPMAEDLPLEKIEPDPNFVPTGGTAVGENGEPWRDKAPSDDEGQDGCCPGKCEGGCCGKHAAQADPPDPNPDPPAAPVQPGWMRLAAYWPIVDADDSMRVEHPDEFECGPEDQKVLDAVQSVVDLWETQGVTIDQGGQGLWYELELPDGCEALQLDETIAKARQILADVARELRAAGISGVPALPPEPEAAPTAKALEKAEESPEEPGETKGLCDTDSLGNRPGEARAEDFYFGVGDAKAMGGDAGDSWLVICPKKFFDENHDQYDQYMDVQHLLPRYLGHEDMECTWILPDGMKSEEVAIDMTVAGFERNLELEGLYDEVHES